VANDDAARQDIQRLSRDVARLFTGSPVAAPDDLPSLSAGGIVFIAPARVISTTGTAAYTQLQLGLYVPQGAKAVLLRAVYGYTADAGVKQLLVKPDAASRLEYIVAWGAADASAEDVNSCGVCQVTVPVGAAGGKPIIYYKIDTGFDVKLDVYVDGYML